MWEMLVDLTEACGPNSRFFTMIGAESWDFEHQVFPWIVISCLTVWCCSLIKRQSIRFSTRQNHHVTNKFPLKWVCGLGFWGPIIRFTSLIEDCCLNSRKFSSHLKSQVDYWHHVAFDYPLDSLNYRFTSSNLCCPLSPRVINKSLIYYIWHF